MKKSILFFAIAGALCGLASCGSGSDKKLALDYMPVQPREDAKWGFIGPDGKMLYEDEFKEMPSMVINGVFTVKEDGGISVYEATAKKPTLIPGLEELVDAGMMNEGLIPIVRKNERIKLVDKAGKEKLVFNPVDGNEIIRVDAAPFDGLFTIKLANQKVGVMNTSGKVLIAPKYTSIRYMQEDRFFVSLEGEPDSVGIKSTDYYLLDGKGKQIVKFKDPMSVATSFVKGKSLVMKGDDRIPGYINTKGEFTKLPSKIHRFSGVFDGKLVGFETEEDNVGVMNMEGEIIIRPKYKAVLPIPEDKFLVKNDDNQWFILNKSGEKETVLDDFEFIFPVSAFGLGGKFELVGAEKKHRIDLYDYTGKALTQESFYDINLNAKAFVESDYFNPEEIGRQLVSFIDSDGVNGVKFGTPVSKLLPKDAQAKSYSDKWEYKFTDVPEGYKWTLDVQGNTNGPIASPIYTTKTETYWFSTYTRQVLSGYKFNDGVKIDSFTINAESDRDFLEGALSAVDAALKEKGFKEVPQDDEEMGTEATMYQRGPVLVAVGSYFERNSTLWIGVSTTAGTPDEKTEEIADSAVADSTVAPN